MEVGLLTAVLVFATLVWALSGGAAVVGFICAVFGERVGRCPRRHHYAMTLDKKLHERGCPPGLHERFEHAITFAQHQPHLHHH